MTTLWGFLSQFNVPPYTGETPFAQNVQTSFYSIDLIAESSWILYELSFAQMPMWTGTLLILVFNPLLDVQNAKFNMYSILSIAQILTIFALNISLITRLAQNLLNLEYLLSKYGMSTLHYQTIIFLNPLTINFSTMELLQKIVWWRDFVFGNKKQNLYFNFLTGVAFSLHPLSLVLSTYYLFQIPLQLFLDLFVYIWYPQFDMPYVTLDEYVGAME